LLPTPLRAPLLPLLTLLLALPLPLRAPLKVLLLLLRVLPTPLLAPPRTLLLLRTLRRRCNLSSSDEITSLGAWTSVHAPFLLLAKHRLLLAKHRPRSPDRVRQDSRLRSDRA
jgi:hypothetical protein